MNRLTQLISKASFGHASDKEEAIRMAEAHMEKETLLDKFAQRAMKVVFRKNPTPLFVNSDFEPLPGAGEGYRKSESGQWLASVSLGTHRRVTDYDLCLARACYELAAKMLRAKSEVVKS